MAAGYDGNIKISTKIDQTGFNAGKKQIESGLGGITRSLKTLAVAAGIAFGAAAIINFGKASIKAATDLENAMTGLQSIMDGQGRSFSKAQQFINDYVSDGLVPATQAITAYKNLALRGYDDSQIQQVMIALKDSAAYGRQASYSLGEAVSSATEGLKNENSILVDNAGVTKNVAKMWDDYAKSIGTTATNLTKQQKIQAEVTGILEESKYQVGDAAKVANTYSGQIMQLSFNFNNLKIAIGNALIPIARAVLPSINAMITGLVRLANVFAQVTTAIFGKQAGQQKEIATSGASAAKAETGLAKATKGVGDASKKTNKELNNTLANFDELNVLAKDTADSTSGIEDALADAGGIDTSGINTDGGELFGNVTVNPKIQAFIDGIKASLQLLEPYIDSVKDAWDRFKDALARVWEKLEPVRDAASKLFEKIKEMAGDKALDLIAGGAMILAGALDELSGLILIIVGLLTGDWDMAMEGAKLAVQGLGKIIEGVFIIILGRDAVEAIKTFISEWATRIAKWWTDDVAPWFSQERWAQLWTDTKQWWADGWAGIKDWWSVAVADWWKDQVAPWFTKAKWVEVMQGVKEGFAETFKNAVNAAIALFNQFIGWVNKNMRFEWDAIEIAGKQIVPAGSVQLFTIPTIPPIGIPKLATGAVIPPNAEFMAILGDQKRGVNIETPLETMMEAFDAALNNREGLGGGEVTINFAGSMAQFVRDLKPYIDKENSRRGASLIKGVTG